ncbi:MAG: adenylosuccinate synthase [Spirochaetales bacterium]|nr:adenylosuccinate synthase [Spirochaetales bacterium]
MVHAVVGLNWGDEGKGRMVDYYAAESDMVVRFQGGSNAGHTVKNEKGDFAFHSLPSGVCYPEVQNVIASGAVLNPKELFEEMTGIGEKVGSFKLLISDRAILTLPYHVLQEKAEEERLGDKKYGSTLSGIAPGYGDKFLKKGIQTGELLYPDYLRDHVRDVVDYKNFLLASYGIASLDAGEIYDWLVEYGEKIIPYIGDAGAAVSGAVAKGQTVLLEAQLGALRDISHGIYPYTTSSSVLAGYACASVPVKPSAVSTITGITKAYSTCVGDGAFVTELSGEVADRIRETGKEYGAKTGRPRRIGWFDTVATRYGCRLQGADEAVMTCLDVLSGLEELKVCTAYRIGNQVTGDFPVYPALLEAEPVYETLPGWKEDLGDVRSFDELPPRARSYVEFIEDRIETRISCISVGPRRDELFFR